MDSMLEGSQLKDDKTCAQGLVFEDRGAHGLEMYSANPLKGAHGLDGEEVRVSTNQEQGAHGLVEEVARVSLSTRHQVPCDHGLGGAAARVIGDEIHHTTAISSRVVHGANLGLGQPLIAPTRSLGHLSRAAGPSLGYTIINSPLVGASRDARKIPGTSVSGHDGHRVSSQNWTLHHSHGANSGCGAASPSFAQVLGNSAIRAPVANNIIAPESSKPSIK
ncbi:hypothetical protein TorRG33x02_292280, partial [Trema orientale]